MKSKKYRKYHASKYAFPTHMIKGNGNTKGKLIVGSESARQWIESKLGRKLNVVRTDHSRFEWIFCEAK